MKERRAETRMALDRPLAAKVKSSLPARVLDVSSRGMQIELSVSLRLHSECEVRVRTDDGEVSLRGVVRRCRATGFGLDEQDRRVLLYRAGLEFPEIHTELLDLLRREVFAVPQPAAGTPVVREGSPGGGDVFAEEEPGGEGQPPLPAAPARGGPVRIRISSENVRRLLERKENT